MRPSTEPVDQRVSSLPLHGPHPRAGQNIVVLAALSCSCHSHRWPSQQPYHCPERECQTVMGAKPTFHPGSSCLFWLGDRRLTCVLASQRKLNRTVQGKGLGGSWRTPVLPVSGKLGLWRARLSRMEDPGLLPSRSTSQWGEGALRVGCAPWCLPRLSRGGMAPKGPAGCS